MKQRNFKFNPVALAVLSAISSPLFTDFAYAGAGWADSPISLTATKKVPTFYANSPSGIRADASPTAAPGATVNTGTPLRKFVDSLPGLGAAGANNLLQAHGAGQYIPVAVSDTTSYPGSDYYEIGIVEYTEKMHSDLPKATTLRGYVQLETAANAASSKHIALKYPDGTPIKNTKGAQIFAVDNPHYLGPLISATRGVPVRVKYSNLLPKGHFNAATGQRNGDLFLPVDKTLMGAGTGPNGGTETYTENRAVIHLHGGDTPWISDGTPHQWITPAGETTSYKKGVSARNVPDMPEPEDGSQTLFWTNNQSARLMFYHDHAVAITRLNVYGGMAAGYLLSDPAVESTLPIPTTQIPLVIQDKTFVPADIAQQDAKWDTAHWGKPGDLWFAHVYETNQDPTSFDGTNPPGRWDWGPWFWPVFPSAHPLPTGVYGDVTTTPEAFMDTPVVNGTAYPNLAVEPKAYRFRILSAANDRSLNLGLYVADPLTVSVTAGGSGYSATPAVTIAAAPGDTSGTTATATATVVGGVITGITATVTGPGFTALPIVTITDATGTGATTMTSINTEVKMVSATPSTLPLCSTVTATSDPATGLPTGAGTSCWPDLWPTDGRAGGVPDPLTAGPQMIQIGNEGGLLPSPVVIPSTPVNYEYNRRSVTVLNVFTHGLYMGPAERADVVIDFSQYAGKTLIVYNDAPAPVPGFDPRIDYYTGNPDQTGVGGAPSTLPGYGPNTRTIMQIRVSPTLAGGGAPVAYNPAPLASALTSAYAASQPKPIVAEMAYNATSGIPVAADTHAAISTGSAATPTFNFTAGDTLTYKPWDPVTKTILATPKTVPAGTAVTDFPVLNKAIQELFEPSYGRMNATLGIELPFTSALVQTTIPLGYVDPATETISDGETQLWKITHNGVDTHPVHFHLVNVQVINRIGWDGTVKPPADNEVGWKETVKMNPLEDIVVAVRAKAPLLPFGLPDSIRRLDPTQPLLSTMGFTQVNPATGNPAVVRNRNYNFGWEYVWHCHILGHEENDFMRPLVFKYNTLVPPAPTVTGVTPAAVGNTVSWTDPTPAASSKGNAANEQGFIIQRATVTGGVPGAYSSLKKVPANTTTAVDMSAVSGTTYSYRVVAYNAAGSTASLNSLTGTAASAAPKGLRAGIAPGPKVPLAWVDNSTNETGFAVWRSANGGAATQIATTPARTAAESAAKGGVVRFTDTGVSAGQTYAYYVTALSASGPSAPSNTAIAATPTLPAAPTGLSATAVAAGLLDSVTLTWVDNANNETRYVLQSKTGTAPWVIVNNAIAANATAYTQTSVPKGTTIKYLVRAFNAAGFSALSNVVTVTTP